MRSFISSSYLSIVAAARVESFATPVAKLSNVRQTLARTLPILWFVVCAGIGADLIFYALTHHPDRTAPLLPLYFALWVFSLFWGRAVLARFFVPARRQIIISAGQKPVFFGLHDSFARVTSSSSNARQFQT